MAEGSSAAVMAGQRASAVIRAGGQVLQHAVQWLDVGGVEVDEMRLGRTMRIMAGGAGGAIIFDMRPMTRPARDRRTVHHGTAVAFVAQGKVVGIVRRAII